MSSNILNEIRENSKIEFLPILSEECEKVIVDLMEEVKPKNILEIGTCVGYSSTIMLQNSDAHIDTIEIDEERRNKALEVWKEYNYLDRVTSILGNVDVILEDVIKGKEYDFIFLDGPKSRYLDHLKKCIPSMHKGTVVLADDVLFFGLVKGDEWVNHKHRTIVRHLREFVSYIENTDEFETTIIDEGNGIAILRKQ